MNSRNKKKQKERRLQWEGERNRNIKRAENRIDGERIEDRLKDKK